MTATEKRQELLDRANELGLSFPPNIPTAKLEDKIREKEDEEILANAAEVDGEDTGIDEDSDVMVKGETEAQMRERLEEEYATKLEAKVAELRVTEDLNASHNGPANSQGLLKLRATKEATKLIRCVVTNRNPLKSSWEGEIMTVSNDLIGTQRKYVPYNLEEGYHLPQIIINTLRDKECTIFVNGKTKNGEKVKQGKLIKEYAIEILEPLTRNELDDLAMQQAARGSIDSE